MNHAIYTICAVITTLVIHHTFQLNIFLAAMISVFIWIAVGPIFSGSASNSDKNKKEPVEEYTIEFNWPIFIIGIFFMIVFSIVTFKLIKTSDGYQFSWWALLTGYIALLSPIMSYISFLKPNNDKEKKTDNFHKGSDRTVTGEGKKQLDNQTLPHKEEELGNDPASALPSIQPGPVKHENKSLQKEIKDESKLNIVLTGLLNPGVSLQEAEQRLSKLFKTTPEKVRPLLQGRSTTIRKNLNPELAEQYRKVLSKVGVDFEIVEQKKELSLIPILEKEDSTNVTTENEQTEPSLLACPKCGYQAKDANDPLLTKHNGLGECPKCGIIPKNYLNLNWSTNKNPVDKRSSASVQTSPPLRPSKPVESAIWDPNSTVNWSFVLTPVFGSYLQMLNWQALDEPEKAASSQKWFYASLGMVAFGLIMLFLSLLLKDAGPREMAAGLGLIYIFAWYFFSARPQAKYVKERFGSHYARKSWSQALLIGFAINITLGFSFYTLLWLKTSPKTSSEITQETKEITQETKPAAKTLSFSEWMLGEPPDRKRADEAALARSAERSARLRDPLMGEPLVLNSKQMEAMHHTKVDKFTEEFRETLLKRIAQMQQRYYQNKGYYSDNAMELVGLYGSEMYPKIGNRLAMAMEMSMSIQLHQTADGFEAGDYLGNDQWRVVTNSQDLQIMRCNPIKGARTDKLDNCHFTLSE